jgi:hypothetical protein
MMRKASYVPKASYVKSRRGVRARANLESYYVGSGAIKGPFFDKIVSEHAGQTSARSNRDARKRGDGSVGVGKGEQNLL